MKSEAEIRKRLEDVYRHRLGIRVSRCTSRMCRNCVHGMCREFDLGEFGSVGKWVCRDGHDCGASCGFECKTSEEEIEDAMIREISDPSICGAKEPKIAMLMWVLHGGGHDVEQSSSSVGGDGKSDGTLWKRIRGLFG